MIVQVFLAALAVVSVGHVPVSAESAYRLVWSDEFQVPGTPDPGRWTYENGYVRNGEPQFYT
jgi:hypothetical protein